MMSDEYQQEPYPPQYDPYSMQGRVALPFQEYQSPEIAKLQLLSEDIIESIEKGLLGEEKNFSGEWIQKRNPIMNKQGVDDIITLVVKPRISRIFLLSNFDKDMIARMSYDAGVDLTLLVFCNYKKWGLDSSKRSVLIGEITDAINATLRRALEGNELQAITRTHHVNQMVSTQLPNQGRLGAVGTIKNWLRI